MKIPFFGGNKKDKSAKEFIAAAHSVYNYRRDVMDEASQARLRELIIKAEELFESGKTSSDEYKKTAEEMEKLMRKHGGMIYPLTFWADNVDVVIVAGILALTVRSFFVQTFQIPTNSMYPSFYGMTPHVYKVGDNAPSGVPKLARAVFKGASNYKVVAPEDGEAYVEMNRLEDISRNDGIFTSFARPARKYFVLPSSERVYSFRVNDKIMELPLPPEFSLDAVMPKAFDFGVKSGDVGEYYNAIRKNAKIVNSAGRLYVSLGHFKKGEDILNFDILAGDMLLVDRFTYNFRQPKIGEPIVFKTGQIERMRNFTGGVKDDKYYIKRLVGKGGDEIKIDGSTLMRNGDAIKGSAAFEANSKRLGEYRGYVASADLENGRSVKVPLKHYYALGDNSHNSLDSRYWGAFPESAMAGKALIIFYPFTERWGAAR